MRSLYLGVALAALGTLLLAYFAFSAISEQIVKFYLDPVFVATDQLEVEDAVNAWTSGGAKAVSAYMARLDRLFGPSHYLLNSAGIDVVSGKNRRDLVPNPPAALARGFIGDVFVVAHKSQDGRFWFVAANPSRKEKLVFFPYYTVLIGVTAVLCWLAAVGVIWPLRRLGESMRRFGRGELASRAKFRRRDEIGTLASSFNEMADRIERLVTGERQLLQDISHELRSPLTRLKLAIKLARTASDRDAALDRVERDVDRVAALTAELVEMTRAEGEARSPQLETENLSQLVRGVAEDCTPRDIRCDVPADIEIVCDRELLRRAIENVLGNAVRYSPKTTPIDVTASQGAGGTTISIRDFGPGVPENALERIFAPFYRVDEARDSASGGIGLGLAIARSAIHLHGGTIAAHNALPGLRVDITLPP